MAEAPLISAIVVSYNTRETTLRCLDALLADLAGLQHEVWVVDNASSDGSADAIAAAFPDVHLIRGERNLGFGAANNLAMSRAAGEFFLLVNSDAFLRPGAARALLDCLSAHPEAAVAGPRLLDPDGSLQRSCYRFPSPLRSVWEALLLTPALPSHPVFGDYRAWEHDEFRTVDFVIGACMLLRADAVRAVGGFDESFFVYAEETDLCYRLAKAGMKVAFTPKAEVVHLGGQSGKSQPPRTFTEFHRSREVFIRKHWRWPGLWLHRAATVTGAAVRMVAFSILWLLDRRRRGSHLATVGLWARILGWNLGLRGPGLRELTN